METVKVDVQKLQLLNERIVQTIDALNQLRMSVHGIQHSPYSFGGYAMYNQLPFAQQAYSQQAYPQQVYPQQAFVPQSFGPQSWASPSFGPQSFGPQSFGPQSFGPQSFAQQTPPTWVPPIYSNGLSHSTWADPSWHRSVAGWPVASIY